MDEVDYQAIEVYRRITQDDERTSYVAEVIRQARTAGAQEMLEMIRGSLRGYPHAGGDIEVMEEVDRIKREALERCEAALRQVDRSITLWMKMTDIKSDALEAIVNAARASMEPKCGCTRETPCARHDLSRVGL